MKHKTDKIMLKKTSHLFGLSLMLAFALWGCQNTEFADFEKGEGELLYKLHSQQKGPKAKVGDFLSVQMDYRTNEDSLLFDSHGKSFPLELVKPVFKGDINSALSLMAEGDSATFVIRADSFLLRNAKMLQLPDFVDENSKIIFDIKLHKIETIEELENQRIAAEQRAIQQEKESIIAYTRHYMPNINTRPSGLYFKNTKQGKGKKAQIGRKVSLHYVGKFLNGKEFSSSYANNTPARFTVGRGEVIAGWEEAVSLMRQGDEATIVLPSALGYKHGRGEIPAHTPLVFELKLIEVK